MEIKGEDEATLDCSVNCGIVGQVPERSCQRADGLRKVAAQTADPLVEGRPEGVGERVRIDPEVAGHGVGDRIPL